MANQVFVPLIEEDWLGSRPGCVVLLLCVRPCPSLGYLSIMGSSWLQAPPNSAFGLPSPALEARVLRFSRRLSCSSLLCVHVRGRETRTLPQRFLDLGAERSDSTKWSLLSPLHREQVPQQPCRDW